MAARPLIKVAALSLICGAAIGAAVAYAVLRAQPAEPDRVAEAKALVTVVLKDPESVQFRSMRVGLRDAVCGEFNAKNSFGGYAGFKPFILFGDADLRLPPDPADEEAARLFASTYDANCADFKP